MGRIGVLGLAWNSTKWRDVGEVLTGEEIGMDERIY